MTFQKFRSDIRKWVEDTLGITTIYSHGTGPRPKNSYAVMNVLSTEELIKNEIVTFREINGDIRADYVGIRKAVVSINIYRDDTMEQMIKLKSSLDKIITQDYFNSVEIGIIDPGLNNHIPEQIGKSWENRSQCDFNFHYVPTTDSDSDISEIKRIEITNEINDTNIVIT